MGRVDKPQLRRMAEAGLGVQKMARAFDVHKNTVYAAMDRMGLPRPSVSAAQLNDGETTGAGADAQPLADYPRIDVEIALSGGLYAKLAEIATRHGLPQARVAQKWHQIRRNPDLMAAAAAEAERRDQADDEADTSRRVV